MNTQEHLLVCLSEECSEVAKEVSKSLRFGLDDVNPVTKVKNRVAIAKELNDLIAVATMLYIDLDILDESIVTNYIAITAKKDKVNKYIEYAKTTGALND